MATPLLINGYRVSLLWAAQAGGRPWSTKFDYVQQGAGTPVTALQVAQAFRTQFESLWGTGIFTIRAHMSTASVLQTYRVYRLTDPLSGVDLAPVLTINGSDSGVYAAEVAACASLRTGFLGRRYRGRQYWGGLGSIAVSNSTGQLAATLRTNLVNLVFAMNTLTAGGETLQHSVISGQGSTSDRPPGLATPVANVLVDQYPDTQRRRGGR